ATEIGLTNDFKRLTERLGDLGIAALLGDQLGTLIDEEDPVDELECIGGSSKRLQRFDAVVGLVVGGDPQRRLASSGRLLLCRPLGALEHGALLVGDDVEPEPAAIAVLVQIKIEVRAGVADNLTGVDALAHT